MTDVKRTGWWCLDHDRWWSRKHGRDIEAKGLTVECRVTERLFPSGLQRH